MNMRCLKNFSLGIFMFNIRLKLLYFIKVMILAKNSSFNILVENEIVIEVKSCEEGMRPVHQAQLLSYLKLADKRLGFLINFNVTLIKDGFKRLVNNY